MIDFLVRKSSISIANLINLTRLDNHTDINPNPLTNIANEASSVSHQKYSLNLSKRKIQFLVLFLVLLIIVFVTTTCMCVVKMKKLNNVLETNKENSEKTIQELTIQLSSYQQKMSMQKRINRIISQNLRCDFVLIF